jgi:hypothetical protein
LFDEKDNSFINKADYFLTQIIAIAISFDRKVFTLLAYTFFFIPTSHFPFLLLKYILILSSGPHADGT